VKATQDEFIIAEAIDAGRSRPREHQHARQILPTCALPQAWVMRADPPLRAGRGAPRDELVKRRRCCIEPSSDALREDEGGRTENRLGHRDYATLCREE
jgi:hypothetical protein